MNQENCAVVLETLRKAASQNAEQLKPAEQQLKCWETEKWFYSALLSIFSDHTVEVNVRWLAVLYIKNGIERYWRKTATKTVGEDEKKVLRQKMISNFHEPVNQASRAAAFLQLALQLAVLVSKVARFDCPTEWPELVPTLLQVVRNPDDLPQQRSLLVLHHVTKSLASKRLAGDRRVFQEQCSEVLFLTIFHEFRETLAPLLLEMIQGIQPADGTISFQAMLNRDAVYTAVGLAAFDLHDELDFDNWFLHVLIPELKVSEPRYRIVRRRVAWLIGQWVGVKMSPELRPVLYKALIESLDPSEDLVISILHVTSFIIERVGSQIMPFAGDLVQYLPLLWETCGEHHMLRCAIVTTLVQVVNGLGAQSERLHPFLLPVVAFGVDVRQSPHVYLLEDCLDLWWALLANTRSTSVELLQLAQYLFPLFELGSENMKMCLQVVQAYILLFPKEFLQTYGDRLLKATTDLVNDLNREGMLFVMRMVELVIRVFPEQGPQLFYPLLVHALEECLEGEKASMLTSVCLSIISRVILHCKSCFTKLLQEEAQGKGCDAEEVFGNLLDKWIEKMPLVNPVEREKLLALTLTSILTSNSNAVYERICGILLAVVEVLNDVTKCDNLGAQVDSLVIMDNEPIPPNEEESEHDRRKIELSRQDPVHTVALRDYLCSQMRSLRESLGERNFEELMAQVDVETMQQLKTYLEGNSQTNAGSAAYAALFASGNQNITATLHTSNTHPT
ncbi:hypothetical protein HPB49_023016 [Dermacentor silvarum]|uniref:Uncharacterized protein n=1 Tax=Dermacentor silvarum TaxID=543639 RepID=A0ACB8DFT1_DERSI|nr:hypothetical protein HPB49_023016 [Dermacentor silvarum]